MGSKSAVSPVATAAGLLACGAIGSAAVRHSLWGLLAGAALVAIWLTVLHWLNTSRAPPTIYPREQSQDAKSSAVTKMLLDAAPTPLLGIEGTTVHALNRAARLHFASDDRILPVPAALLDGAASHLRHEGRSWRIDRVDVPNTAGDVRTVVALVDVEHEERVAEARATSELIHVLGHELLNGLAPIVSLAESGLEAVGMQASDPTLLPEILGTLARRAEGLQRFTEAYRALARLPEPCLRLVTIEEMVEDLARLFAARWPHVILTVDLSTGPAWPLDRDQLSQAIWAILQNASEAASTAGEGPPRVRLSVHEKGNDLVIGVDDNGAGIPEGCSDRIFRPFHTTKPDGTGIGLSLARQIAHAHGGTLSLEQGAPTTFRLTVPKRIVRLAP